MKNVKVTTFSQSIIFKSLLFLVISMLLIVTVGTYFFTQRQLESTVQYNYSSNEARLQQLAFSANNEMEQFGSRLSLLAKTSEIATMDPVIAAGHLKSYTISSMFSSGETVSLYDLQEQLICDNSMLETAKAIYPVEFGKISPHRPYVTPWYREGDGIPKRAFAAVVSDRTSNGGYIVASFSMRRLWKYFSEFKVGQNGFVIAINTAGEILYHPDLKKWMDGVHRISETGFEDFNVQTYEINKPTFIKLNDGHRYLINYNFNAEYNLGLITLQPKSEIDASVSTVKFISKVILAFAMLAILLVAFWLILILGRPMNRLIEHISKITNGNIDIDEINVGNRKDEIGQLSRAFNQMHSTIKRQIKELNAHREMLEQEVQERTQELEEANKKLDLISRTDDLTQLPNRRDMHETIDNEVGRSARTHKPFCFIFFDIDHFKNVNDTYGHAAGDLVLKAVSSTIRGLLRKYDVLARYGGEEFLTLLPETDLEGAAIVAERFRKKIEKLSISFAEQKIKVTITLGVALYDDRLGADRSIQQADKALYEGKETGRNKVVIWDPERTSEEDYKQAAIEEARDRR